MCGIAGIWRKDGRSIGAAGLVPSLDRIRHRGPDDEGVLVADLASRNVVGFSGDDSPAELGKPHWASRPEVTGHVVMGHRRLSIIDLSPRGHQPMSVADGKVWIVFNGEIYNYVELREELRALGHRFETDGDTEVILRSYLEWGHGCLHRFNGDWAFGILDLRPEREPELFLARDRYGIKPLFIADTEEALWFASEAKALVGQAVPFVPRDYAVGRFLLSGELPPAHGNDTFVEGIRQLAPGEAMTVAEGASRSWKWYDLAEAAADVSQPDCGTALKEMAEQVTAAVRLRLRADVPVGSCLSGGVDSSSIVGTMRQLFDASGHGELHTFSAVYRETGNFNEEEWIRSVVEHSGSTPHYTFPDEVPLDEMFDRMVWHQDEPFQTASIFAQWCVMREARAQGVVVLLDGQAADELLGGYQPGTYQEQFLEWIGTGKWGRFAREWWQRKFATGLSFPTVITELAQTLVLGTTGRLKVQRRAIVPRDRLRMVGFRDNMEDTIYPKSDANEEHMRAKLAEDIEKLRRWTEKLKKKPDDAGLKAKIAKKKELIGLTRRKLALAHSRGLKGKWIMLMEALRAVGGRMSGRIRHDFRKYLLAQVTTTSLAHLLRFEDRNSMAFSIEARVPFTDFRLIEWAFTRANEFKIYKGWTKWLLRMAMKGRAPESVLWRRDKTGFETPDITMTRRLISHTSRHPVDSAFLARYLEPSRVRTICDEVLAGTAPREQARLVWRWLVLDSWQRQMSALNPKKEMAAAAAA